MLNYKFVTVHSVYSNGVRKVKNIRSSQILHRLRLWCIINRQGYLTVINYDEQGNIGEQLEKDDRRTLKWKIQI